MTMTADRIGLAVMALFGAALLMGAPLIFGIAGLFDLTVYLVMSVFALSLALVWGYCGIVCFGQAAFFGLGAYSYAIAAINIGESTLPVLLAVAVPVAFAALLGYFLFYGRLNDVYLGVITLVVTLIFHKLISSTGGTSYRIGEALLGGYNGIPAVPSLNLPGNAGYSFGIEGVFRISVIVLMLTYFGLRIVLASHFGKVVVAIRENEQRAELIGYDARRYKLVVFMIGAGIAGLAGCLYATWGSYVGPDVFSLPVTAQVLMWIIVGGVGTLVGPIIGCFALQMLVTKLGTQQLINNYLVLGAILLLFVSFVPRGVAPWLLAAGMWLCDRLPFVNRAGPRPAGNVT